MTSTAAALLAIAASWALLAALLVGNGLLLGRLLGPPPAREDGWRALWVGFAGVLAFLQLWHLVLPVGEAALAVVAAAGALGLWLGRAAVADGARAVRAAPGRSALGAAAVLWLADRALGPPVGDALLYHLSAIRWTGAYPAVPGLANLSYRLGFNSASLLWSSLVDVGPWEGRGSHVAAGVLVGAWALRAAAGLLRTWRGTASLADRFAAFLLAPIAAHAVTLGELRLSTSDPDTFCGLLALAAVERLLAATAAERGPPAPAADERALVEAALLAAACGAVKAPGLLLAVALPAACVVQARRAAPPGAARRVAARSAAALAMVLVPWAARGVVLSGYPVFPSAALPFPVDWTTPREIVVQVRDLVRGHYMPPVAQELATRIGPLRAWLFWQLTRCPELVLAPAAVGAASLGWQRWRGPLPGPARLVLLALAPAIAAWAVLAPAPRFAYGFFWAGAATLAATLAAGASRRLAAGAALALALLPPLHRTAAWAAAGRPDRVLETWVLRGGLAEAEPCPLRPVRLEGGLVVSVPAGGGPIGDAPLLATDRILDGLEPRRPGDLGAGFRIRPRPPAGDR